MIDVAASEEMQWQLLGQSDVRLRRVAASPVSSKTKK